MRDATVKFVRSMSKWGGIGALLFWLPDIIDHALLRNNFDSKDVRLVSWLCPLTVVVGYSLLYLSRRNGFTGTEAFKMLVGIWCLGGFAMLITYSFAGGGLVSPNGKLILAGLAAISFLFPPFTCMMAAYDGSLFALIAGSACLIFIGVLHLLCSESHRIRTTT